MKSVKILSLAFGLILLVSAAGFAQTQLTTTSSTLPVAPTAQTGLVGEVAFSALVAGTIPAGENITINYDAPISSTSGISITIPNCNGGAPITGTFPTAALPCTGTGTPTVTVSVATGTVGVIQLAFGGPAGSAVGTIAATTVARITGVRVNVAASGKAVGSFINASITGSTGFGTITNNVVPVAQVVDPIQLSFSTFPQFPQAGGTSAGSVTVTELFANAFETQGATFPTQVILNVTAPTGFSFVSTGYTSNFQIPTTGCTTTGCASQGVIAQIASVSGTTITLTILQQNTQLLDSITIPIVFSATAPVPLTPDGATVTATLAPPLPPLTLVVAVGPTLGPDRYKNQVVASATLNFKVGQAVTLLYSVFNVWGTGFNTGFAISNPTGIIRVPAVTGVSAAIPFFAASQPGTIKVWLVPSDGVTPVKTIDTAVSKTLGLGLDSGNGMLQPGAEWTVLLSDLATAAGFATFQGQVFFQTNFSDAHGINFIADPLFSIQSQGYPMLVISGNALNN